MHEILTTLPHTIHEQAHRNDILSLIRFGGLHDVPAAASLGHQLFHLYTADRVRYCSMLGGISVG